jgi:hypothetical protein
VKDSRRQGSPEATGGLRLDAKDRERLNSGVQSVLVKEMFRPAELVERIRRLVHGRPPVIIPALDSTFEGGGGRNERAWPGRKWAVRLRRGKRSAPI